MVSYLTILGRTGGGGGRGWGSRVERNVKERERNRKGRGEGPFISSRDVCSTMHICIRIQAERSMYKWDKVVPRGGIAPGWKYASGKLTKARESSVGGGRGGRKMETATTTIAWGGKQKEMGKMKRGMSLLSRPYYTFLDFLWILFCNTIQYDPIAWILQNLFVFNQF